MMKIKFEDVTNRMTDGTGRMDITIDTMQLGLVRVREKDGDGLTGLLVPAWIFYGNNRIISEDGFTRYDYSDGSASSANVSGQPTSADLASKTGRVSGRYSPTRAGTFFLNIPAFSAAISANVFPRRAQ